MVAGLGHDLVSLRLGVLEQVLGLRAHLVRVVLCPLGELAQPGLALGVGGLLLLAARLELRVGRLAAGGERDLELRRRRGRLEAVRLELGSELLALRGRDAWASATTAWASRLAWAMMRTASSSARARACSAYDVVVALSSAAARVARSRISSASALARVRISAASWSASDRIWAMRSPRSV